MAEVINDAYFQSRAGAVGLFERLITGLHQELNSLGTEKKTRGRKSKDADDFLVRRRARLEEEIEMCQRYRMHAMRDIGIPTPAIAAMINRPVEEVESAIRLVQYENIPSTLEPVIAAGKDIEPTKH